MLPYATVQFGYISLKLKYIFFLKNWLKWQEIIGEEQKGQVRTNEDWKGLKGNGKQWNGMKRTYKRTVNDWKGLRRNFKTVYFYSNVYFLLRF